MLVDYNIPINIVALITGLLAWGSVIFLAYRVYKKQTVKSKVWKILIVMVIGFFSFTINFNILNTMIKFPILPLGVWLLYVRLKGKDERWQTYRAYAWLGFWANFIFLASTLLSIPVHQALYLKDEPKTYISNIENASIINIHPSAKDTSLNKESLLKQLDTMKKETIYSDEWYIDTYANVETNVRNERFPYQLIGTSSKWGSGLQPIIFIEDDGKGILLSTPQQQMYFRSDRSLIEGVD